MAEFHFLRPQWFWALIPIIFLSISLMRQKNAVKIWSTVCDPHLLPSLLVYRGRSRRFWGLCCLFLSLFCMVLALAGPTWKKMTVPTYQQVKPRLILLDLSSSMLVKDVSPDRLTRAKFKIHDLLSQPNAGQFALMVYSSEPFLVSPLTEDAQTIDALLSTLQPDILPVEGNQLELALEEAKSVFTEAGLGFGDILVLTAETPSAAAVAAAQKLSAAGYTLSVLPLLADPQAQSLFAPLAKAGQGQVIPMTADRSDIQHWLKLRALKAAYQVNLHDDIPLWRDEGRWFLLPGLLFLLPLFRRGWLERMAI